MVFCADLGKKWYIYIWKLVVSQEKPGIGDLYVMGETDGNHAQNAVVAVGELWYRFCHIGDIMEKL